MEHVNLMWRLNPKPKYLELIDELGVTYFVSGANSPGDILGFAATGHDVGSTVSEFVKAPRGERPTTLDALGELAATDTLVFLDSGAFGEVDDQLRTVKHISTEEWNKRLAIYEAVARLLGDRLYVVVPDRIGDQDKTLERQARHREQLQRIHALGANLLVPLPRGELSPHHQLEASSIVLDLPVTDLIPALPTVKAAMTLDEAVDFVAEAEPARVHLLGMSPLGNQFDEYVAALRSVDPELGIYCDAARMKAISGYYDLEHDRPRPVTAQVPRVREELEETIWSDTAVGYDYTDMISEPSGWLTAAARKRLADNLQVVIDAEGRRAIIKGDIDTWIAENRNDWIDLELDRAWREYMLGHRAAATTDWLHRRALELALGPRVIVLTSCTGSKVAFPEEAERLYTGRHHTALMQGVTAARNAGLNVEVWIVSAGLGVIHGSTVCEPYDATFAGQPQAAIRQRAQALGIPKEVRELLAGDYDIALVLLGRDYLIATDLIDVEEFGGPVMVPVAPSALGLLPDNPHIFPEPLDAAAVVRLGGQVKAKGEWARRFLTDLEPW
jgi:uncharacterized protein DUF6884